MGTDYDTLDRELAEGRGAETLRTRSAYEHNTRRNLPLFYRYVVIETIFDPSIIDKQKLEYFEHDLGILNIKHAIVAPRNSIIARRVMNSLAPPSDGAMVLYPFFPPSLSLPCKPGEHVWVMFESPDTTKNDIGYWFCRIVEPNFVEDANHTHPPRKLDPSFTPTIKDLFENTVQPKYEFNNGQVSELQGTRYVVPETALIDGPKDAYKKLLKESDGGKITHYEPVPRYRKRPGDIAFEGQNNSLIVLGRDRVGPAATYKSDDIRGQVPSVPLDDSVGDGAGMIDIVAGRGQTETTGGKAVDNDIQAKELAKSPSDQLSKAEGDPDFVNDRSRVLISQRTNVDQNFELTLFNLEQDIGEIQGTASGESKIEDPEGGAGAIVLKSDKVRIIARSDMEIIVPGFDLVDDKMTDNTDLTRFAAVIIKANGDIIIRPAEKSYIKLGGDDADKALVCTDFPATAVDGTVSAPPIVTNMGGLFAGTGFTGQGMYASKVLVVGKK